MRQPETSVPARLQLLLLAPRRDTWINSRTPQGHRGAVHRRDEPAWAEGATGELCALSTGSQSSSGSAGARGWGSKPVPGPPQPHSAAHSRGRSLGGE